MLELETSKINECMFVVVEEKKQYLKKSSMLQENGKYRNFIMNQHQHEPVKKFPEPVGPLQNFGIMLILICLKMFTMHLFILICVMAF